MLKRLLTDVHECSHMQPSEARGKEKRNTQIGLYKFAAEWKEKSPFEIELKAKNDHWVYNSKSFVREKKKEKKRSPAIWSFKYWENNEQMFKKERVWVLVLTCGNLTDITETHDSKVTSSLGDAQPQRKFLWEIYLFYFFIC